jgi:competence protein ComEA
MALITSCIMRTRYNTLLYQRIVMALVALAMTFVLFAKGRQTGTVSGPTALSSVEPAGILVQISGDVAYPGMYEISDKKMTNSVIQMSKPLCNGVPVRVDTQPVTLLQAGDALLITCKGSENSPFITVLPMKSSQCLTLGIPLDLNLMTVADFDLLPGIGPVLAERIVAYRHKNGDFAKIDELLQVDGVGEKKFQKLSKYFKAPILQRKQD